MKKFLASLGEKIKVWHFLLALVLLVPLSAYLLRQNNLHMIELRDTVLQVDEETGDIEQVEPHLEELGSYILTHMNTNLGRIELPGTFNKAVEEARREAETSGSANSSIYAEAQQRCENPNILLSARAQCIQEYVTANAVPGTDPTELVFPDKTLYTYSFSSPGWSADLAGMVLLITLLDAFVVVILIFSRGIMPIFSRMIENDPLE